MRNLSQQERQRAEDARADERRLWAEAEAMLRQMPAALRRLGLEPRRVGWEPFKTRVGNPRIETREVTVRQYQSKLTGWRWGDHLTWLLADGRFVKLQQAGRLVTKFEPVEMFTSDVRRLLQGSSFSASLQRGPDGKVWIDWSVWDQVVRPIPFSDWLVSRAERYAASRIQGMA